MKKEDFKQQLLEAIGFDKKDFELAVAQQELYESYLQCLIDRLFVKSISLPTAIQMMHRIRRYQYLRLMPYHPMVNAQYQF